MKASPVRWVKEHPFGADGLLAALVTAISLPGPWITREGFDFREPDGFALFLVLLSSVPLAWRRRHSFTIFNLVLVASVASAVRNYGSASGGLSVIIVLYTMAAHCDRRRSLAAATLSAAGLFVVLATTPTKVEVADVVASYVVFAAAWILGDNVRVRRAYVVELEDRTERLERQKAEQARRAVATERGRIARELHDVIAHHVSVMVVQAGGARRVLDRRPDQAREALQSIETTGRQALSEMRRLLGVLRADEDLTGTGDGRAPQPGVAALDVLVDQLREAGLPVDLRVEGEPRPLDSGVDLSAYRIVQEALTNTLKHAGPAEAHVVVRYGAGDVELEITDDGRGGGADSGNGAADGHGLVGMKERVSLFGGELRAGPRPGGGYLVRARLPTP
ncbi:MAG: sensor histidine kinase [Acidimicrobiales bacterium]